MEDERPIEKLVRTAGEKRLAESGGAFELHAATRRILQSEARRMHAKGANGWQAAGEPRTSWFSAFGWSFGVFAGVVVAALLMWPREKGYEMAAAKQSASAPALAQAPSERQLRSRLAGRDVSDSLADPAAVSGNERRASGAPVASDDLARTFSISGAIAPKDKLALKDEAKSADKEHEMLFAGNTDRKAQATLQTRSIASTATAPAAAPASPPAESPELMVTNSTRTFGDNSFTITAGSAPSSGLNLDGALADTRNGPALAKQLRADSVNRPQAQPSAVVETARFARRQGELATKRAPAKAETVLTTFSLQHEGDWLKVVDSDGSIYTGQVQNVAAFAPPVAAGGRAYAFGGAKSKSSGAQMETVAPGTSGAAEAEVYFVVQGTNRSLNKPVTFNGQLLFKGQSFSDTNIYNFKVAQPPLTNASSVSGEARIGTRSFRIEAERQP